MKVVFGALTATVSLVVASPAAQAKEDAPTEYGQSSSGPPAASTGFQLALRAGVALPMGTAQGAANGAPSTDMSSFVNYQVPLTLDLGWKIKPYVFAGIYGSVGFGGGGSASGCGTGGTSCTSASFRGGLEVRYDVLPDRLVNPWIAYAIGLESTGVSATTNGVSSSTTLAGWDWARFMVGTEFRTSSVVGLGPYVEFSLGEYSKVGTSTGGHDTNSDVASSALHEWLSFGLRGTLFP